MRECVINVCGDDAAVLYFDSKMFLRKLSAPLMESLVRNNLIKKCFFIYQVIPYIYEDHSFITLATFSEKLTFLIH